MTTCSLFTYHTILHPLYLVFTESMFFTWVTGKQVALATSTVSSIHRVYVLTWVTGNQVALALVHICLRTAPGRKC